MEELEVALRTLCVPELEQWAERDGLVVEDSDTSEDMVEAILAALRAMPTVADRARGICGRS